MKSKAMVACGFDCNNPAHQSFDGESFRTGFKVQSVLSQERAIAIRVLDRVTMAVLSGPYWSGFSGDLDFALILRIGGNA
jgi:hypothetical protein